MPRTYCRPIPALCLFALVTTALFAQDTTTGGIIVYKRLEQLEIRDTGQGPSQTVPLQIVGAAGLKVAFLARATGGITSVPLNMFDSKAQDNTTPQAYDWVDDSWRPILYRCDRFRYNGGQLESTVRPETAYESLRFHGSATPGNLGVLTLRNFVIYRGEDVDPPAAPSGLTAAAEAGGVRLSWRAPQDNVGVALYAISRAGADGKFVKVAETSLPAYVDKPPAAGAYRYRVLAADFQDNLSPWSESVATQVGAAFPPPRLVDYETDRLDYAPYVRRIHDTGKGQVKKGRVLQFGDSLSGASLYRLYAEAALGRYMVEARGRAGWTSSQGRSVIAQDLRDLDPEFCLILYGTNNDKSGSAIAAAMEDLLAISRACASRGAVPIVATLPPRGFTDPRSQPEASYNAALVKACRANHTPIAYIFEELQAQPDRRKVLADDGIHWAEDAFAITSRVWRRAMDEVAFALLDRPE